MTREGSRELVEELRRAVFDSEAVTERSARAWAAASGAELDPLMSAYLRKVRDAAYRVGDADISGLRDAGHGDEEIFELTIATSLGAALAIRAVGWAAMLRDA